MWPQKKNSVKKLVKQLVKQVEKNPLLQSLAAEKFQPLSPIDFPNGVLIIPAIGHNRKLWDICDLATGDLITEAPITLQEAVLKATLGEVDFQVEEEAEDKYFSRMLLRLSQYNEVANTINEPIAFLKINQATLAYIQNIEQILSKNPNKEKPEAFLAHISYLTDKAQKNSKEELAGLKRNIKNESTLVNKLFEHLPDLTNMMKRKLEDKKQ